MYECGAKMLFQIGLRIRLLPLSTCFDLIGNLTVDIHQRMLNVPSLTFIVDKQRPIIPAPETPLVHPCAQ